jgi:hypothetical protein
MRLATFFKTFAFGGPVAASSCRIFSSSAVIPIYKLLRVKKNSASKDYSTFRYHVHYNVEVKRKRQSTIEEKRQIKEDKHT